MDFKQATDLLSVPLKEVARVVGRKYRSVVAYRRGEREVPADVWKKLAAYMHQHSAELAEVADELVKLAEELEGVSDTEDVICDDEVRERLSAFESEEFPSDDCIFFAEYLSKYCRGEVTEGAVRTLVGNFPDDRLPELVRKHLAPTLSSGVDYCEGQRARLLAIALGNQGFNVRSGWRIAWPGGELLEGDNICRLALLAVWLRGIGQRGAGP